MAFPRSAVKLLQTVVGRAARASTVGMAKGDQFTRYAMYDRLRMFHAGHEPQAVALSISHSEFLCRLLGFDTITAGDYPSVDLLNLPYADASFDAVCADQVLEHIEGDPFRAIDETFRVLKPGGLAVHTTCFLLDRHGHPQDFWRYTPNALRLLASRHGEILDADGWGHPLVLPLNALGVQYVPVPHAKWHPLHWLATMNAPAWAMMTWVVARKHRGAASPASEETR
jgi:SAM-dependent methyltransferase